MEDMQAVYDEEVNGGGFGLMSLMRGTGDMVLGEDIMNNLPELLRAFEGTNLGTQEGLSEISRPMETEGFALELSTTPGLESMVGPEMGLALGALGGGGKGKTFKEMIEELQRLAGKMASDKDIDATRYADETNLPDFLKSFSQKQKERRLNEDMYTNRPSRNMPRDPELDRGLGSLEPMEGDNDIDRALSSLRNTMDKNPKPFTGASQAFGKLSNEGKQKIQGILNRRNKIKGEIDQDMFMDSDKVSQMMRRLESFNEQLRPYYPDIDKMASGGRPGLYANINAKRKRIAAGSGERMRKKGEKGAPTAANFRESAKTAKKANGGGLNYMKGYYGKSYK